MATQGLPANVHVSRHPCVAAKMSQLRSRDAKSSDVQRLVHEIATIVACDALGSGCLDVVEDGEALSSNNHPYATQTLHPTKISLIPILRSGLSMVDALHGLLPHRAPVHHLGLYREKSTLQPVEYYNNLPYHKASDPTSADTDSPVSDLAILLDPIVATGATLTAAIETLRDWGVRRILAISVLGSRDGLVKASGSWPGGELELWVGGCDEAGLDAKGMLVPGLGDVGDRLFGTGGGGH